jgi:hypothetical protein
LSGQCGLTLVDVGLWHSKYHLSLICRANAQPVQQVTWFGATCKNRKPLAWRFSGRCYSPFGDADLGPVASQNRIDRCPACKTLDPQAIPSLRLLRDGRNVYTFGNRHSCFTTGLCRVHALLLAQGRIVYNRCNWYFGDGTVAPNCVSSTVIRAFIGSNFVAHGLVHPPARSAPAQSWPQPTVNSFLDGLG